MSEHDKMEQTEGAVAPAKEKKAKVAKAAPKKPGVFARLKKWLRELKSELKKVQWPTTKQTLNNVGVVIVCVIIVGIFIWIFDSVASGVVDALLGLFGKT